MSESNPATPPLIGRLDVTVANRSSEFILDPFSLADVCLRPDSLFIIIS